MFLLLGSRFRCFEYWVVVLENVHWLAQRTSVLISIHMICCLSVCLLISLPHGQIADLTQPRCCNVAANHAVVFSVNLIGLWPLSSHLSLAIRCLDRETLHPATLETKRVSPDCFSEAVSPVRPSSSGGSSPSSRISETLWMCLMLPLHWAMRHNWRRNNHSVRADR